MFFVQYDDLRTYGLIEIVIDPKYQNQGLGTFLMSGLERRIKLKGASIIQLAAVNDESHDHFYDKLGS